MLTQHAFGKQPTETNLNLRQDYLDTFNKGGNYNERFWARFGGMPDVKGCTVMDAGCALGRMCVDIALAGAERVVGIDIVQHYLDFAQANLEQNYPHLVDVVEFKLIDLKDFDETGFDYIVSKESFEHMLDLPAILAEMKRCLKPGGRLFTGFGPLWNSPYGDHRMTHSILPWFHLLKSEDTIIRGMSKRRKREVVSIDELGMNMLSLAEYRRIFNESGMKTVRFEVNRSSNIVSKIFTLLSKLPWLEEYFTHNIYCILEKE